jgi:hypothetical protein
MKKSISLTLLTILSFTCFYQSVAINNNANAILPSAEALLVLRYTYEDLLIPFFPSDVSFADNNKLFRITNTSLFVNGIAIYSKYQYRQWH